MSAPRGEYRYDFATCSRDETLLLGRRLGALLRPGDVVCLEGDLGVGKTVFAEGVGESFELDDYMSSPTYTIVNEYRYSGGELYHFDLYRLSGEDEVYDMDFDSYFGREAVMLIEWPDRAGSLIPEEHITVRIDREGLPGETDQRRITVTSPRPLEMRS